MIPTSTENNGAKFPWLKAAAALLVVLYLRGRNKQSKRNPKAPNNQPQFQWHKAAKSFAYYISMTGGMLAIASFLNLFCASLNFVNLAFISLFTAPAALIAAELKIGWRLVQIWVIMLSVALLYSIVNFETLTACTPSEAPEVTQSETQLFHRQQIARYNVGAYITSDSTLAVIREFVESELRHDKNGFNQLVIEGYADDFPFNGSIPYIGHSINNFEYTVAGYTDPSTSSALTKISNNEELALARAFLVKNLLEEILIQYELDLPIAIQVIPSGDERATYVVAK